MSIANQLGLGDLHGPAAGALQQASRRWAEWRSRHPALSPVPALGELPRRLSAANPADADQVLLSLAELGAPDGGNDLAATAALAWVLLPGAGLIAYRLYPLSARIDALVATQLWLEARTFPWRTGRRVAANILRNTRKGVLRDLGVGIHADPAWRDRAPLLPGTPEWRQAETQPSAAPTPAEELADVLAWACKRGAITRGDRALLLELTAAADLSANRRLHRGQVGLMTPAASGAVAARRGISPATVRRRALRAVGAVAETCSESRHTNQPATRAAGEKP